MKEITSKKKLSMLNMICSTLYQIALVAFGFLLPNMIMNHYGAELHGYTTTVSTIMSYVALVNAGLAPAAIQALYRPLSQDDRKELNGVLNAVNRFYTISGLLYTFLVFSIAFILPFFISDELPRATVILLMIVIGATNTLECFIYCKYRVLLQADQRLFVVSVADMIAYILRIIVQVVLISFDINIVLVMGAPIIMVLFRSFILYAYCKKRYGQFDSHEPPITSALSKRWSAMIHQIANLVVNNTDVLLLSAFGSLVDVSIYSVYNIVFTHLSTLMTNVFNNSIIASFGRLFNEKTDNIKASITKVYTTYEYVYYAVTSFIFSVCAFVMIPFVSLYTRNLPDIPYVNIKLYILFIVIGVANNMRTPCLTLIIAAGHFKETQGRAIIESVINLLVSLILIKPLGVYGLLIGTICSYSYRTIDIIIYSHKRFIEKHSLKSLLRAIRSITIVVASVLINIFFCSGFAIASWSSWVLFSIAVSLIVGLIILLINIIFEPREFKSALSLVIKIKK